MSLLIILLAVQRTIYTTSKGYCDTDLAKFGLFCLWRILSVTLSAWQLKPGCILCVGSTQSGPVKWSPVKWAGRTGALTLSDMNFLKLATQLSWNCKVTELSERSCSVPRPREKEGGGGVWVGGLWVLCAERSGETAAAISVSGERDNFMPIWKSPEGLFSLVAHSRAHRNRWCGDGSAVIPACSTSLERSLLLSLKFSQRDPRPWGLRWQQAHRLYPP